MLVLGRVFRRKCQTQLFFEKSIGTQMFLFMTNRGDKKNAFSGSCFRLVVAGWIALHDLHNTDIGTGLWLQLFHSLDAKI